MAKRGVGGEALLAYVEANPIVTKLEPETIVYLNDLGVPENVVAAMIRKADADQPQPAPAENQATQGAPVASTPAPPAQTQPDTAPSAPPADNNYFHRSLAPYGDWIYDGRHGWVWRPTVAAVDTGWRPYCHGGRWIYSDVGWYWHSTYSWGWAPFHYGRWHRSSIHGWYWVPGYRWSPAWVHWRSSDIYCGWAPLPPGCDYVTGVGYMWHGSRVSVGFHFGLSHHHYTYCDYAYLRHRRLHRHRVRDNDVTIVHNETKVVNNHITENNTTIINNGVPPELVEKKTREPVRKVRIREVDLELESIARVGQIDENGKTLAVYRPTVPTPPDSTPGEKPANRQQVSKTATPDTTEGEKPSTTDNNTDDDKDNGRRIAKQRGDSQLEKPGNTKISGSKGIVTPSPFARSGGSSGKALRRECNVSQPKYLNRCLDTQQALATWLNRAQPQPRSLVQAPYRPQFHIAPHTGKLISTGGQVTGACQTKFHRPLAGLQALHAQDHGAKTGTGLRHSRGKPAGRPEPTGWKNQQHPPVDTWLLRPQHASPSSDARTLHLPEFPTEFTVLQGAEPLCPPRVQSVEPTLGT